MEENKVAMAVDFGNSYIRVAIKLNGIVHSLENEDGLKRFPQVIAVDEESTYFCNEAENNLIGYCDSYYKNFKYNCIVSKTEFSNSLVTKILSHFKQMCIEFAKNNLQEINDIDTIILAIPLLDPHKKWREILMHCSINAGFMNISTIYEEKLSIYYFRKNNLEENNHANIFFIFNLGSLSFSLSKWAYAKNRQSHSILIETKGGISINTLLQNLFNNKIREIIDKSIFKTFIKPDQYDINKLFNNDAFENNKKYIAECHRKYQLVLDTFSGKSKSMHIQFRHVINKQEIEIEILRGDIDEIVLFFKSNIKIIIDEFKKCKSNIESKYAIIIIGNGIKIPGIMELFASECKENFFLKNIFINEEILKEAFLKLF